jgi:hypothetical protein
LHNRGKASSYMGRTARLTLIAMSAVLSLGLMSDIPAPQFMTAGEQYFNETLVPTNQLLNPAGRRLRFSGRPVDIAVSPRGNDLAVLMPESIRIYSNNRRNLPHTAGGAPKYPTPSAMVADNDLALGKIIEAITKSRYWSRSAIFVTEDDAQNGGDHIDGHRTLCFVVSPFTKRGAVDSTHYNQTSVLRTIEEILG